MFLKTLKCTMARQSYRCNRGKCRNETFSSLPTGGDLRIEFEKCSQCGRLIVFSTLYAPVAYKYDVFVGDAEKRPPFYSTEDSQERFSEAL